jgi:hypothetical protein
MVLSFVFPAKLILNYRIPERGKEPSGEVLPPGFRDRLDDTEFVKNAGSLLRKFAASANR